LHADTFNSFARRLTNIPTCASYFVGVPCPAIADIVLILDQSTSIVAANGGYDNWNSIIGFATSIANSFPISPKFTQIGLMKFSSNVDIQFYLNTYNNSADLTHAIQNLEIDGGETDISDAIMLTRFVILKYSVHCTRLSEFSNTIVMLDI